MKLKTLPCKKCGKRVKVAHDTIRVTCGSCNSTIGLIEVENPQHVLLDPEHEPQWGKKK